MTDMKCPFCGSELQTDNEIARLIMWRCHTPGCLLNGWHSAEIIQHLIDGKKAQRQLRTVKDRCVKKIKAKELEIHNCLYGIHVRGCEIETLQEKLSQAQDSLKEISRLNQYIRKELAHQIPEEASKADNSIYTITFEIAKECRKGLHNKIEDKSDGR